MGMDFNVDVNVKTNGKEAIDALERQLNKLKSETVKINVDLNGANKSSNVFSNIQKQAQSAGKSTGKSYNTALQTQIETMARTQKNAFSEPLKNITKEQQSYIDWWDKALKKQEKSFSQYDATIASNKTLSWLKNNTKAVKDYGDILTDLANKQRSSMNSDELKSYTKQVNAIKTEALMLGKTGRSFADELTNSFQRIGQFVGTYGIIQQIPNTISESVAELKEVDNILTEISKTSDLTDLQLKQLGKNSFDEASKWGKKASDYLLGIQEMSRSGYYGKQAEEMANLSVLTQAAGDMTADMSNNYLLASNAAYQYNGNIEKLNALLDGQNMINRMVMPCRKLMAS